MDTPQEPRRCGACKAEKPLAEFYTDRSAKDGYAWRCKVCSRAAVKASAQRHPERVQARLEKWRAEHPDHIKAYSKRKYDENREELVAKAIAWRLEHYEQVVAREAAYREANREKIRARRREIYGADVDRHSDYCRKRRAKVYKARVARVVFTEIAERDNWTCGICGEHVERKDASLDHVIPLARGGSHEPANIQLAHRRCNSRKWAKMPETVGQPVEV